MTDVLFDVPDDLDGMLHRFGELFPGVRVSVWRIQVPMLALVSQPHERNDACLPVHHHGQPHPPYMEHPEEPSKDRGTADPCGLCARTVPWVDVVTGRSTRAVVGGQDVRLCFRCAQGVPS